MKTILIDDEPWAMKQFERECSSIRSIELVGVFDDSLKRSITQNNMQWNSLCLILKCRI